MQTDALKLAQDSITTGRTERLSWGLAEFQVTDLDRTVAFWIAALGLGIREKTDQTVALGTRRKTLFKFHSGATAPVSPSHMGMYHIAVSVPDQAEFSRLLARMAVARIATSPVDHLMSKAIYLQDPDGLEIEIALETPERFSHFGDMVTDHNLYDSNGNAHSGRERLDTSEELSHAADADLWASLSDEAEVSHIHFRVAGLEDASAWFEGIGFARNLMLPKFGLADMGAGGPYTHRIAMNIWAGPNLPPAPENTARLIKYALQVHDPILMATMRGLQATDFGLSGTDPTGTEITMIPAFKAEENPSALTTAQTLHNKEPD